MVRVRRAAVWAICVCALATPAGAATIGQWMTAIGAAAVQGGLFESNAQAKRAFDEASLVLTDAGVLDEEITDFFAKYANPDALAVARRRQDKFSPAVSFAVRSLKQVFAVLPGPINDPLRAYALEQEKAEVTYSQRWNLGVLDRLSRKYGPQSAKLNGIEVLAALALQRTPGFGLDANGSPGPLEAVIAYSAAYLTRGEEQLRIVSVAEFGLRQYIFSRGWGGSGRLAWLRPGYVSYGVAVAGESDDPMRSPFQGTSRVGGFFGWGEMKVAWLATGADKRFLVTQQVQIIPWVF